ncbi:MAG: SDR family NAD(P)-dependent oxidoreductase [Dehalococcoidia bacterium]
MTWNDKPVLVTGGCGFIGINLVSMLVEAGARVRVYDNLSVGTRDVLDPFGAKVQLVQADVRDLSALSEACHGIDVVIHLAAQPGVIPSILDPQNDYEINAGGTFNALLAAQRAEVGAFVLASSNAVVGEFTPGTDETKTPRPLSPYGASKMAGEAYCSAFAGAYGMRTVALRFANAYGPRSTHKQSVIARWIKRILDSENLVIYGDGKQIRDFIHVQDMCRAMMLAAESDVRGEVFHIASGRETTVLELVQLLGNVVGRKLEVVHEEQRDGEALCIAPSVEKAKRLINFEAQVALPEGLAETYAWFQGRHERSEVAL